MAAKAHCTATRPICVHYLGVTPCNVAVPGSTNLDLTEMSLSHGCHRQSMSQVSPSFCEGVVDNDLIHRG